MLSSLLATFVALLLKAAGVVGQGQTHNLTPDGYWHNRYHALLSMAVYGEYNFTCPLQTFTAESEERNFPNSSYPPWNVISTFGPTPSGCSGFTAIVPEMNKALIVFRGDYEREKTLPTDVVGWDAIGLGDQCHDCTVNRFAAQGYMECKNETNNWAAIREAYYGQGLVFSITGHGLGGMHSLIASVDLNHQDIDYYSHNYGTPRTFNNAGALYYNYYFNGEAGERGIAGNDLYTEFIPASENYTHAGTPFYYSGLNTTTLGMNWYICWNAVTIGEVVDDPACAPQPQDGSTAEQDHWFYFSNVGQCGGQYTQNTTVIDAWLNSTIHEDEIVSSLSSQASASSSASAVSAASASMASLVSVSSLSAASVLSASIASAFSATKTAMPTATPVSTPTATITGAAVRQNAGHGLGLGMVLLGMAALV